AMRPEVRDPEEIACLREVGETVLVSAEALGFTRSPAELLVGMLDLTYLAERLRDPHLLAPAYATLGAGLSTTPFRRASDGYFQRARSILAGAPGARIEVQAYLEVLEANVHIHRGAWESALRCVGADLGHRRGAGDWRGEVLALAQGFYAELHRGDMTG